MLHNTLQHGTWLQAEHHVRQEQGELGGRGWSRAGICLGYGPRGRSLLPGSRPRGLECLRMVRALVSASPAPTGLTACEEEWGPPLPAVHWHFQMDLPMAAGMPRPSTRPCPGCTAAAAGCPEAPCGLAPCSAGIQAGHGAVNLHSQRCGASPSRLPRPPHVTCLPFFLLPRGCNPPKVCVGTDPQGLTPPCFAARAAVELRAQGVHSSWPSQKPHLELERKTSVLSDQREAPAWPQLSELARGPGCV